jgi:hypothetical protein
MAAIAKVLSRASGTDIDFQTLKILAIFCGAGLFDPFFSRAMALI